MKRTRLFLIVSVLLVTMLLSNNIILRNEKQESGDAMLASSFHSMNRISRGIDELLTITGQQETDYEMCEQRLVNISHEFMELHATLKTYASNFPSRKMQRSSYTSQTNDFEFIAGTLTSAYGEVNGYKFFGITEDNFISKKEIQYLVWLKESVDELKIDFASEKEPLNFAGHLSTEAVERALDEFFTEWSWHNEPGPFRLLGE